MTAFQRQKRKVVTVAIIQAVGFVLILLQNILLKNWLIVTIFSTYTLLSGINYLGYFLKKKYTLWAIIMMVLTAMDFAFYVWNGGVQGAGIFWSLSLPFLAMYLLGHKMGGRFSLFYFTLLLVLSLISLLVGYSMPYTPQTLIVFFLVSYINVYLLFTLEKNRHEMREEVERITRLFDHASDLLFIGDRTGHFTTISPSCVQVLGWSREELLNKVFIDFVHPDDKQLSMGYNAALLEAGGYETLNNRFRCKDGSYKWLSWRTAYDHEKKLVYAVARDITAEKHFQLKLQASEEAFRTLAEQSNAGIYIVQKGRFIKCNRGFLNLVGYEETDVYAMEGPVYVHPDDVALLKERMQRHEMGEQGLVRSELRILTKQGELKWVDLVTDGLLTVNGHAVIGTMHDITSAKTREEKLRRLSELQGLIADVSADFINSTPDLLEEKIISLLERFSQLLGYDRAVLYTVDDNVTHLMSNYLWQKQGIEPFHSVFKEAVPDHIEKLTAYFKTFDHLYVPDVATYTDETGWLAQKAMHHPLRSILLLPLVRNRQTMGVLGFEAVHQSTAVDPEVIGLLKMLSHMLTEVLLKNELDLNLQVAAQEMETLNQTKDKLFSIIAHDLRSPFNTIIGFTELMADKEHSMTLEAIQGYASMLNQVALVSFELLENLLDWSRLQRGILKPEVSPLLVDEFLQVTVASYMDRAQGRTQQVNVQVEPGLKAHIDKRMMETVIRNLFTNAIKFTPDGGVITLQAMRTVDRHLRIAVADTGIGIPSSLLPLLFTVNESKNRAGLGGERSSGLGLMLCKEFVELHGGRLWVETTEYKGSTFYVEIPCLTETKAIPTGVAAT